MIRFNLSFVEILLESIVWYCVKQKDGPQPR